MNKENRLYPEDQGKVDEYLSQGFNRTERKPFKPFRLLLCLFIVVPALGLLSFKMAEFAGVAVKDDAYIFTGCFMLASILALVVSFVLEKQD